MARWAKTEEDVVKMWLRVQSVESRRIGINRDNGSLGESEPSQRARPDKTKPNPFQTGKPLFRITVRTPEAQKIRSFIPRMDATIRSPPMIGPSNNLTEPCKRFNTVVHLISSSNRLPT